MKSYGDRIRFRIPGACSRYLRWSYGLVHLLPVCTRPETAKITFARASFLAPRRLIHLLVVLDYRNRIEEDTVIGRDEEDESIALQRSRNSYPSPDFLDARVSNIRFELITASIRCQQLFPRTICPHDFFFFHALFLHSQFCPLPSACLACPAQDDHRGI